MPYLDTLNAKFAGAFTTSSFRDNHRVLLASAIAGLGIVQLPSYVGDAHPELVPVMSERDEPSDVWLVVTAAKRRLAAVRAASDAITRAFRTPPPARARRHARA